MDVKGEFLEILEGLKSEKLAAFSQKLIKSPEILGVKTPELRRLAKRNFARLNLKQIAEYEPFFHEEFMLKGFLIMLVKDDEAKFKLASEFIKTMPNWAVTDGFEPKFASACYIDALLKQALGSNLEYEKRFFTFILCAILMRFRLSGFLKFAPRKKTSATTCKWRLLCV